MKFAHINQYVADVPASLAFYKAAFGLATRFVAEGSDYAEMESGAVTIAFTRETFVAEQGAEFRRLRATDTAHGFDIGFTTDDVHAAFSRAVAAGASPIMPPQQKPWGQVVGYVRDLNGTVVEIGSPMAAAT
ncbi:VOC family protein [Humitalea sp. 24SJ18S-53]|uniref:VOC family protein n=1 Tax=Humitalea sp. 24SJ18S-53 TaxID=3422307 RepID=UPI003D67C8B5